MTAGESIEERVVSHAVRAGARPENEQRSLPVPEKILQEIQDLVMFYDIAKDLAPEENKQLEFVLE